MARQRRVDRTGAEYHVMNRGVARRTLFDTAADHRFFLACLARAVRRGEIVVLAYALMRTHFHLLVRSRGGLSTAMRRVQLRHARRFNRMHRRDGPLLRGRFLSKPIEDHGHGRNTLRYIHENPVVARICQRPAEYPWSSAWIAAQTRIPKWFSTEALQRYQISPQAEAPGEDVMRARADVVEARLHARSGPEDLILDTTTPDTVVAWMRRKAELSDGSPSTLPQVGPATIAGVVESLAGALASAATSVPGAGTHPTRDLLMAGLMRDVACASLRQIAARMRASPSRVRRLIRCHRRCLALPDYAHVAARIVKHCGELQAR